MSTIAEKVYKICKNKKNANEIQERLTQLEQGDALQVLESLPILQGVFSFYLNKNIWKQTDDGKENTDNLKANDAVNVWLHTSYKAFLKIILTKLYDESDQVQVAALEGLMNILKVDYCSQRKFSDTQKLNYPNQLFLKIVKQLIFHEDLNAELIESLRSILLFADNQYYCLKNIHSIMEKQSSQSNESYVADNVFNILSIISKSNSEESELFLSVENIDVSELEITKSYKSVFSAAWLSLLRFPRLSSNLQKKILVDLDTKVIPQLTDPKLLIDFLSDSYDLGGVISLLSLNSLFVLINQYNLDYPDFYAKLYTLLDPSVFAVKYKSRFFHLLDLFLSSTHLPAYLVAAFVKKLSRISLFTPAPDQQMLLTFIRNLLIRHPSSRILVHRKNDKASSLSVATDPFNYEEVDPSKSNAMKSCLWELNTIKSHYLSQVLKSVRLFQKDFPKYETDISDCFDKTYQDIFDEKVKRDTDGDPPLNFVQVKEIFENLDQDMWELE